MVFYIRTFVFASAKSKLHYAHKWDKLPWYDPHFPMQLLLLECRRQPFAWDTSSWSVELWRSSNRDRWNRKSGYWARVGPEEECRREDRTTSFRYGMKHTMILSSSSLQQRSRSRAVRSESNENQIPCMSINGHGAIVRNQLCKICYDRVGTFVCDFIHAL